MEKAIGTREVKDVGHATHIDIDIYLVKIWVE